MQSTASLAARLRTINMTAMKAGAGQSEPGLRLPNRLSIDKKDDASDTMDIDGQDGYVMTTFPPFNPGATHVVRQSSMVGSIGPVRVTNTASKAVQVQKKPWPCSLPRFLQPQVGTTYALMHNDASPPSSSSSPDAPTTQDNKSAEKDKPKPISAVQAVLYGDPSPKEFRYMGEVLHEGEFLYKVLYGGGDKEGAEKQGEPKKWKSKLKKSKMQLALEATSKEYEDGEYLGGTSGGDGGRVYEEDGKIKSLGRRGGKKEEEDGEEKIVKRYGQGGYC